MKRQDYESLTYRIKFFRALRAGAITLLVALLVLAPSFWAWKMNVEKRQVLREAKNVVLNMNLLSAQFLAETIQVTDSSAANGLSAAAEERIRSHSAAEGDIQLVAWDNAWGCARAVNYRNGHYLVQYQYDRQNQKETWEIFLCIDRHDTHKD